MPEQAAKGGWRHPGWSWTVRRGRWIAFGAGLGTWLFGVGVSAGLVLIQGGLAADSRLRLQWTAFPALGLAIVVWAWTWIARAGRARMLNRNGVAYLVRERARDWAQDSPDGFYAEVRERFADVVAVPRPDEVGRTWDWPLEGREAQLWDAKVTDLVSTFRVLLNAVRARHTEERTPGVPDAIFRDRVVGGGPSVRQTAATRHPQLGAQRVAAPIRRQGREDRPCLVAAAAAPVR